ncbi:MAG: hypothetical protein LBU87_02085 [Lactobacillales bacterium]|jgi:hypothetical protein|nr:hypothetical protein [Lactobacillales bacterium]
MKNKKVINEKTFDSRISKTLKKSWAQKLLYRIEYAEKPNILYRIIGILFAVFIWIIQIKAAISFQSYALVILPVSIFYLYFSYFFLKEIHRKIPLSKSYVAFENNKIIKVSNAFLIVSFISIIINGFLGYHSFNITLLFYYCILVIGVSFLTSYNDINFPNHGGSLLVYYNNTFWDLFLRVLLFLLIFYLGYLFYDKVILSSSKQINDIVVSFVIFCLVYLISGVIFVQSAALYKYTIRNIAIYFNNKGEN